MEGTAKVDGSAEYIHHLRLAGVLHGRICRSTVAHARLLGLDTAAALAVDGVHAVVTARDVAMLVPDPHYGPAFHDQPILAIDKVRHVGEPVAIVLATDPHAAEAAADLIDVHYDPLPAVFDEVAAAQPGAPVIHDVLRPAGTFTDLKHLSGRSGTNVALETRLRRGDAEQGFAAADFVFEHTFRTGKVTHVAFEPMVSVAEPRSPDGLTIHTSSQSPSFVRTEISRLLGWPENRVRVRTAFLGGGFGAKLYIKLEAMAAVCALLMKRPVRIALAMDEQFCTITKHGATVRIKTGVTREGRMIARHVQTYWNGGAYADIGPRVTQKSGFTAAGPYDIEHVALDNYAVYTNDPPAGALRGFGISQLVWAYERQADLIARALSIDPLEFRRRNVLRNGRPHAVGTVASGIEVDAVLDRLAEKMAWQEPFDRGSGPLRRGRGIAIGLKACVAPTTSAATVVLFGDGSCAVHCGTVDMGQASNTVMAQMAAEVLGLSTSAVRVVHPDTDVTPYDMATLGSRSTFHMGHAVRRAADDVRTQVLAIASSVLQTPVAELDCRDGAVTTPDGRVLSFREVMLARFAMQAGTITGVGTYTPTYATPDSATGQSADVTPFWMLGAAGAEIEVDCETGRIRVTKLVNVADVGRAINPASVERQLIGAAIMQVGFTLFEEMLFSDGQVVNATLADYKIPGFLDIPVDLSAAAVEIPHPAAPFGAKGVGETGVFAPSPAIANALYDAVGIIVPDLPLTPERVLRALREADGRPLRNDP